MKNLKGDGGEKDEEMIVLVTALAVIADIAITAVCMPEERFG